MTRFHMEVRVKPRPGLLNPEGEAVHHALDSLGFPGVSEVRIGKVIDLRLEAADESDAIDRVEQMCRKLLANPVTEDFTITARPEAELAGDRA